MWLSLPSLQREGEAEAAILSWLVVRAPPLGGQGNVPCKIPSGVSMHSSEEETSQSSLNLVGFGAGHQAGGLIPTFSRIGPPGVLEVVDAAAAQVGKIKAVDRHSDNGTRRW